MIENPEAERLSRLMALVQKLHDTLDEANEQYDVEVEAVAVVLGSVCLPNMSSEQTIAMVAKVLETMRLGVDDTTEETIQ